MRLRAQVTAAAMVGANQPLNLVPDGSALDPFVPRIEARELGQKTLDAIALVTAYEEAGAAPRKGGAAPEPAQPDSRPLCSSTAASHLATILADRARLLPEWLRLLGHAGRRPPEERVPAVLDAAANDKQLRTLVLDASGPLGVWLSQFRPRWSWVHAPELDEAVWESGSLDERLALLLQLRTTRPAKTRELVQATWASEPADARRKMIEAFAAGLSLEDEPFLESCLDDRSITVRRAAADLLASLLGSQLSVRMQARLEGRLRLTKTGLLGRTRVLEIEPFEELADALQRDGIEKKPPPSSKLGERAWWTAQALAAVDPSVWSAKLELSPAQLLEAARNGQWGELFSDGWRQAAIRHRAPAWLDAFVDDKAEVGERTAAIFRAMAPDAREAAMAHLLRSNPQAWLDAAPSCCNHEWSPAFTETFLSIVKKNLPKGPADPLNWSLGSILRSAAYLASPAVAPPPESEAFAELADTLAFRRSMRQALTGE